MLLWILLQKTKISLQIWKIFLKIYCCHKESILFLARPWSELTDFYNSRRKNTMWKGSLNPIYLVGNVKVVVSECLGLSLFFSVSFLIITGITVHNHVKEHMHEQFWCPLAGFCDTPDTSFGNKPYLKVDSMYLFGVHASLKTIEDFVSVV